MAFPISPTNDDLHTEFGRTFKYSSATNSWSVATPDAPEDTTPSTQGYVDKDSLPLAGVVAGSKAFVEDGNKLFIFTGNGWFEIATINTAPTITQGADASYALNDDGTATVITLQAADPENTPIIWGYQVASGSLEDTTVTNVDNVFTITPGEVEATFDLTFTASDGVNIDTSASSFTLQFGPNWGAAAQTKIQASDRSANDEFGYSVAISGDTVIAGSRGQDTGSSNAGAAYIFTRSGTAWVQQQKILASDAQLGDNFGHSVAIDGDTVIVSAPLEDTGGNDAGAAYIFTRSGTTWTQQAKIQASDKQATDRFGGIFGNHAVAISGDTCIVGASDEDTGADSAGAAYIFTRSGTTWTQQAKLQASTPAFAGGFGRSVSASGNTVVVGSGAGTGGLCHVFTRTGTTWTEQQTIAASDAQGADLFGDAVDIDGDTIIVGASGEDTGFTNAGAAYIFTRSGTTWTEQAKIQASDAEISDGFGYSVSIEGDTAIVGAYLEDTGGTTAGSVYVFSRSGTTWTQKAKIQASDRSQYDHFGWTVAIDGNTAIVGAHMEDTGASSAGSAYIFVAE